MGQRAEVDSDGEILRATPLRDEVDDLVAAWRAQRPDLDVEPMQVLSRISRLARHLDIARRGAFAAHDLESWEFDVLSALRRAGPPFQLTPGALLRATLVTSEVNRSSWSAIPLKTVAISSIKGSPVWARRVLKSPPRTAVRPASSCSRPDLSSRGPD